MDAEFSHLTAPLTVTSVDCNLSLAESYVNPLASVLTTIDPVALFANNRKHVVSVDSSKALTAAVAFCHVGADAPLEVKT